MPKSVKGVMQEFKGGQLHSGSSTGKVVTNPKQAIAIALSEQRQKPQRVHAAQRPVGAVIRASQHPHRNLGKFLHPKKAR